MCIYFCKRKDLKYGSREHVIPAGLGGKMKLGKKIVSSEFNKHISSLENRFLRDSIVSVLRQLYGPGKRGSLTVENQPKGRVHLVNNMDNAQDLSVGYMKQNRPMLMTSFTFDFESKAVQIDIQKDEKSNYKNEIICLAKACREKNNLNVKTIEDNRLPISTVFFAYGPKVEDRYEAFFFKHPEKSLEFNSLDFSQIADYLEKQELSPIAQSNKVIVNSRVKITDDFLRIIAKICFNFLAELNGCDFVLHEQFDPIRDWIANGGENKFVEELQGGDKIDTLMRSINIKLPDKCHFIYIMMNEDKLYALSSLYRQYDCKVLLAERIPSNVKIDGFICDWLNNSEYFLNKFIEESIAKNPESFINWLNNEIE
ncbi:hypothetical protein L3C95_18100 [Chitinophaga filiformis]|uniref:hypothetical protein n=1 Tax=Chitinophaga filiformis TaxID=104663 RepID=UPI001F44B75B|nr:hypothetical protein [Chitinophaga filiformis]MCF6404817.1 hypothetical protein [Chitinophaga filiformis]